MPARHVARLPVAWFKPETLPHAAAVARLRVWAGRGCPETPGARVPLLGDHDVYPQVHAALDRLPAPVRDFAANTTTLLVVGRTIAGFYARPPQPIASDYGRESIVVVTADRAMSDETFSAVIAHEIAHAWTEPTMPSDGGARFTRDEFADLATSIVKCQTWSDFSEAERLKSSQFMVQVEYWAHAAARAWGFTGHAAEPERYRRDYRRIVNAHPTAAEQGARP